MLVSDSVGFFSSLEKIEYVCNPTEPSILLESYDIVGDTLFYEKPCDTNHLGTMFLYSKNGKKSVDKNRYHTQTITEL